MWRLAGDGCKLSWECRPFPIETLKETILRNTRDCLKATWNMLHRFTTQADDCTDEEWLLCVDVKVQKRE